MYTLLIFVCKNSVRYLYFFCTPCIFSIHFHAHKLSEIIVQFIHPTAKLLRKCAFNVPKTPLNTCVLYR